MILAAQSFRLKSQGWSFPSLLAAAFLLAVPCAHALTWRWSNPLPHGNNIVDMAANGNFEVQVAEKGQIYTGQNFFGWLPQVSGTTNDLQAVKFFGSRIVIVGAKGTVGYSDDGVNFTTSTLNTTNWLVDVAASTNLVVAVGDNAVIYTSNDGANWQYQGTATNNANGDWLLSVAWGAGTWVITGENGYMATSADGRHWHKLGQVVSDDIERVVWVPGTNAPGTFPFAGFWAVTYQNGRALYSTNNGASWRFYNGSVSITTNILYTATANSIRGLLAGDSDVFLGAAPSVWIEQAGSMGVQAPVWNYYASLWDATNSAFHLVGDQGMMVQSVATTNNPYNWQLQYNSVRDWLWQVTLAGDLYVAVGEHARVLTSQNGVGWSVEAVPLTNSISTNNTVFFALGGSTNLLIAAGTRGSLAVSPNTSIPVVVTNLDGTTFTNQVGSLGVLWYSLPAPAQTTNDLAAVCAFGTNFFLVGGNATLLASSNGTNWGKISVPTNVIPTNNYISGLAVSTNLLVAAGDEGLLVRSLDGTNWTKCTVSPSVGTNWLYRVRWLDGWFVAVGENGTLLNSADGTNWTKCVSGTTNWLNDAVMVSNTCYVVGNNGTVLASTNWVNWNNLGTITGLSLYGAAAQNGQLLTVGLSGSILRSQVVPDLTPITFVSYSQSSGQNIFLVAGDPDQKFTLDSSTDLVHWTTGPLLDLIYSSGTLVFLTNLGTNPPPTLFYRATLVP
jgi:hypothetical protein